jgi:sulfatase maturation enzyme AslB (radical SAM superfamily)
MTPKELLEQNQSFCMMPFVHLHVNENDVIKPCCYGDNIKQFPVGFDYATDADFQRIRSDMLAGRPVRECQNCYRVEANGGESYRQRDSAEWMTRLAIESLDQVVPSVRYYDIRNDNTCNLSCRMCHPGASSQLVKEYQRIGWTVIDTSRQVRLSEVIDYRTVEKVIVAGGEPTIMPEFQTFLTRALEHGRQDIELMVITNATNVNPRVFELLSKFTNVQFTVSIDGYDQVNRYIRWPSDWATLTKNIHRLRTITDQVCFSVCVGIWNIANLSQLIKFLDQEYNVPVILINEAMNPRPDAEVSPFLFPDKESALADLELCKQSRNYEIDDFFRNRIDYFINGVKNTRPDPEKLAKFFAYNDQLDASRGIQLKDYIPKLEAVRPV